MTYSEIYSWVNEIQFGRTESGKESRGGANLATSDWS